MCNIHDRRSMQFADFACKIIKSVTDYVLQPVLHYLLKLVTLWNVLTKADKRREITSGKLFLGGLPHPELPVQY